MTIRLQCINFSARPELQQFVQQRVQKLSLFHDQIIDGEVHLKLENYAEKKKQGRRD
jgi:putative sigma-54 modulation protein